MKKKTRGGKRKGSGRPRKYTTKTIRIPTAIENDVMDLKLGYELRYELEAKGKILTIHPMPS